VTSRRAPRAALPLLLLALGGRAAAHWVTPEAIVADLNGPPGKALGVERAVRDEKAPRLLVVRVGPHWYAIPAAKRRVQAEAWLELWRHNIPQGIVAVLDATSDQPVVRYAPGGHVAEVLERADPRVKNRSP